MKNEYNQDNVSGEILVVEDTQASLRLLTEVLKRAGYAVRQASDGNMALMAIKARLPDLVIMDVNMPGMDGYEVCKQLKADPDTAGVPVIFCTALQDTEFKVHAFAQGAVDFITKPYHPEEILVRARTHIELARLRAALEQRVAERTAELESVASALREEAEVRRKVEDELMLAASVFTASYSGIMVTDYNGRIVAINPAFTRIMGYTRDDAIGANKTILHSDKHDEAFYQALWHALVTKGTWSGEVWSRRKDGNVIPVLATINEFRDANNKVTHFITTVADLSESKDAQTLIDFLSSRDSLTGLANHLLARKHFEQVMAKTELQGNKAAILCLDLDRFKVINDSLGHDIGDHLLRKIASRLTGMLTDEQLLSREGGDEFLLIAAGISGAEDAVKLAESLSRELAREFEIDQHRLSITTGIGIALYPDDATSFDDLLKCAENALNSTKKRGGNKYGLFTRDMDDEARLRMDVENCLRNAATNGEFQLVYQPKLSFKTGELVGAEALIRWNSPVLGFVSPLNFIPLAEETGLILAIDAWVMNSACRQIRRWKDMGLGEYKISVNLSGLQFGRGDLHNLIQRLLAENDIPPSCLDLEVTEGILMENILSAVEILHGLKAIGVTVSLDDFGTGYSSLSYLQKLPLDTLKIDKAFVDEIHTDSCQAVIARTIISLGHNLDLTVIAEGVENREQYEFLRDQGCDEVQGYYLSKPLSVEDFEKFVVTYPLQSCPVRTTR